MLTMTWNQIHTVQQRILVLCGKYRPDVYVIIDIIQLYIICYAIR